VDVLNALRRRERLIAAVRWAVAVFALLQIQLYEARVPALVADVDAARPAGFALVAVLVLVGIVTELALRTIRTHGALHRAGAVFLASDVAVAAGFVLVYSFDPAAASWAVLTILPLEGALRFDLPGALLTWAAAATLLVAGQVLVGPGGTTAWMLAYQVGLLLVVAVVAGIMARELALQRRLLGGVAEGSRLLVGQTEPAEVLRVLCHEAVRTLAARSAVVYVHDGVSFQAVASAPRAALVEVIAEDERAPEASVFEQSYTARPRWLEPDGVHPGRLAVPLRSSDGPVSHLLVVRPQGRRPSPSEVEAASSMAEAAALALAGTRELSAEQRMNRRLRYLEALRTRFVATIAHDLRLPLTVFKGVSRLLRTRRDSISTEQVDEMLESVERQANRLSRLADDLLDAARVDSDKLNLHLTDCDLRTVIAATLADVEEDVAVHLEGDLLLRADESRVERILWNLVSNAEKYGQPPYAVDARRDAGAVVLEVRDHGPGLEEAQRDRLFEAFAGGDDAASVGLGLAIVWQLVDAHGGTVAYRDARPGASFTVRLPVAGPRLAEDDVPAGAGADAKPSTAPKR
jgi:signal transduction histidine kinase